MHNLLERLDEAFVVVASDDPWWASGNEAVSEVLADAGNIDAFAKRAIVGVDITFEKCAEIRLHSGSCLPLSNRRFQNTKIGGWSMLDFVAVPSLKVVS